MQIDKIEKLFNSFFNTWESQFLQPLPYFRHI